MTGIALRIVGLVPACALISLLVSGTAWGQFVKIDDFEGRTVGEIDGQGDWTAGSGFEVQLESGTTNHVFNDSNSTVAMVAYNDNPNLELADGEMGTLFFRFQRGFANHVIWGLSDVDQPSEWGDFEVGIGIRYTDGRVEGPLDVRNAGDYVEVADVPEDEWINIWMVVDNANDEFQVYAQSETAFPEQTRLAAGGVDTFDFRNGTAESLRTFFLRVGSDAETHSDDHYLDDIYLDPSGENLASPVDGGVVPLLGDVNLDDLINGLDVDPFVDVLLNGPFQAEADMNEDGEVNGLDVDPFVAAVVGGGSVEAVPEPSALGLLLLAAMASLAARRN